MQMNYKIQTGFEDGTTVRFETSNRKLFFRIEEIINDFGNGNEEQNGFELENSWQNELDLNNGNETIQIDGNGLQKSNGNEPELQIQNKLQNNSGNELRGTNMTNLKHPYIVAQFDKQETDNDLFYIFRYNIPILYFKSEEEEANSIAYWLNLEAEETERAKQEIQKLQNCDEKRKEYQRTLEAKIRRLKARVRKLER